MFDLSFVKDENIDRCTNLIEVLKEYFKEMLHSGLVNSVNYLRISSALDNLESLMDNKIFDRDVDKIYVTYDQLKQIENTAKPIILDKKNIQVSKSIDIITDVLYGFMVKICLREDHKVKNEDLDELLNEINKANEIINQEI